MGISVNSYNAANSAATSTNSTSGKSSTSSLSMQDFLELLAAQLSNQDVMNPESDTQFISQMAQFTSLQTMQTMTEVIYAQYGASMVGKDVVVSGYDKDGNVFSDEGNVDSVQFSSGSCTITVNGKEYDLSAVMSVNASASGTNNTDKPTDV